MTRHALISLMSFSLMLTVGGRATGQPPGPDGPQWVRTPSRQNLREVYPERALRLEKSGNAVLTCGIVADTGLLRDCKVRSESPGGYGFGAAALKLVPLFKLGRLDATAPTASIRIPIYFHLD